MMFLSTLLLCMAATAKDEEKKMPNIYPVKAKVETPFGPYQDKTNSDQFNTGVDFKTPKGTTVIATDDGKIRSIAGGTIIIDNGDDIETVYHTVNEIKVKENDMVKKGESLGITNDRLHYEMKMLGLYIDPAAFIP